MYDYLRNEETFFNDMYLSYYLFTSFLHIDFSSSRRYREGPKASSSHDIRQSLRRDALLTTLLTSCLDERVEGPANDIFRSRDEFFDAYLTCCRDTSS